MRRRRTRSRHRGYRGWTVGIAILLSVMVIGVGIWGIESGTEDKKARRIIGGIYGVSLNWRI